ncbi:tRNA epoxyqueuosine(34) reductase QueG [Polymorphobacter sp. PAMC 29334]|uniref:tRNA epoxyqueuosine(34) reductase QueG n=1 Tax=Polymorphobacter sp. PAMC 29334 TaxID=2862331 RepID=UPI001C76CCFB|nr:tRNA epoxyqueuosine(34) reductase QueG [Polymorphobacter sp. PAMC 29334]QYE35065.1 tRNA epoxyqueuosine(34) reductase QueG [Polymorphobacter sp. PAMC 29334]
MTSWIGKGLPADLLPSPLGEGPGVGESPHAARLVTAPPPGRRKRDGSRPSPEGQGKQGDFTARLAAAALTHGFAAIGIAPAAAAPLAGARLRDWLADGRHGDMIWMAETVDRRASPAALWPEVRSVIMLGTSYAPALDPLRLADEPGHAAISVYAMGSDYHDSVKRRLKALGAWLAREAPAPLKVFVDTAPVMEKPLAEAAGLGWQGKHTNLVSRDHGSWLFLGAIYTTLDLTPSPPGRDRCGSCDACQRACPTDAFPQPYQLDARRCISYLTIEHKGSIPVEFRAAIGNRIYGCDDCLSVCPWNKFAVAAHDIAFAPRAELVRPAIADLLALDDAGFRAVFAGSPVKRIGRDRFVRNVAIAAGNSGDAALLGPLGILLDDPAAVVRGAAIWAWRRLGGGVNPARIAAETDPTVGAEWANPLLSSK